MEAPMSSCGACPFWKLERTGYIRTLFFQLSAVQCKQQSSNITTGLCEAEIYVDIVVQNLIKDVVLSSNRLIGLPIYPSVRNSYPLTYTCKVQYSWCNYEAWTASSSDYEDRSHFTDITYPCMGWGKNVGLRGHPYFTNTCLVYLHIFHIEWSYRGTRVIFKSVVGIDILI